ncbi:transposase, partial [Corynebacterium belfantii]|uniref:transposase n=1 Tax=Corynebacterium belfantii TaxID=2014537 RepID=UPI001FD160F9
SACEQVAPKLGVSASALRQWLQKSRREKRDRVCEIDLVAENARLRQEVRELRDTNELLKAASAFFASELDPQRRK